jgi:hypothetical protein
MIFGGKCFQSTLEGFEIRLWGRTMDQKIRPIPVINP